MSFRTLCLNPPRGLLAPAVLGFFVCPSLAQSNVETLARERGKAIAAQPFGVLSSNLTAALSAGSISNALQFCSAEALPLTASVADTSRVALRRVSHKALNPQDEATGSKYGELRGLWRIDFQTEAFKAAPQ